MHRPFLPPTATTITLLLAATPAATQAGGAAALRPNGPGSQLLATAPHWSTYFGGTGHDMAAAVRRDANGMVYVAGTTLSADLIPTWLPGGVQRTYGGNGDAYVACFDPHAASTQQQLVWCTYLGGSGIDIAFDLAVDAQGLVTVVGLTTSNNFPMNAVVPGHQPALNGPSDGFVVTLAQNGNVLLAATHVGGSGHDRCGAIAPDGVGGFSVVGVTESISFIPSGTPTGAFSAWRGGATDAFVLRLTPNLQSIVWASHVGGPGNDGEPFSSLLAAGGLTTAWELALRSHAVCSWNGDLLVGTSSNGTGIGNTTANCLQAANAGGQDFYVAVFAAGSGALLYGSYLGGSGHEDLYGVATHPAGGFLVFGESTSTTLPTPGNPLQPTHRGGPAFWPSDGYLGWLDPSLGGGAAQVRYGTFLGSASGNEGIVGAHVDSSGLVTVVGDGFGSGASPYPTTSRCLQPNGPAGQRCGALARLHLDNGGADDLVYGTLFGDVWCIQARVVLDDAGDALLVGSTISVNYPTSANAWQNGIAGPRDAVITHLPMLAGGCERQDLAFARSPCAAPWPRLHADALGAPVPGNSAYTLCAHGAPPGGLGTVALGWSAPPGGPLQVLNAWLLVDSPVLGPPVVANALGFAELLVPIPATPIPPVHVQWAFLTTPSCPGTGLLGTSERFVFTP